MQATSSGHSGVGAADGRERGAAGRCDGRTSSRRAAAGPGDGPGPEPAQGAGRLPASASALVWSEIVFPGEAAVRESAAFLFGLVIGSFLNVCIYRIPKGESVVAPRSRCPACGHPLPWYENIPLVSYLALRARCSACGMRISPQYFVVELLTGLLFAVLAANFGLGAELLKYAVFGSLMIALMIIDLRDRLLPDRLTFSGLLLGVGFSAVVMLQDGSAAALTSPLGEWPPRLLSMFDALLGASAGAATLWIVREGYFRWRKVEGMGFGDLKLIAMIGAFLGPQLALLTIFFGSLAGSLLGGAFILIFRHRDTRYELPFGTFLGATGLFSALWGKEIVRWYLAQFS